MQLIYRASLPISTIKCNTLGSKDVCVEQNYVIEDRSNESEVPRPASIRPAEVWSVRDVGDRKWTYLTTTYTMTRTGRRRDSVAARRDWTGAGRGGRSVTRHAPFDTAPARSTVRRRSERISHETTSNVVCRSSNGRRRTGGVLVGCWHDSGKQVSKFFIPEDNPSKARLHIQ